MCAWVVNDASGHSHAGMRKLPIEAHDPTNLSAWVPNGEVVTGEFVYAQCASSGLEGYIKIKNLDAALRSTIRPVSLRQQPIEECSGNTVCELSAGEAVTATFVWLVRADGVTGGFIKHKHLHPLGMPSGGTAPVAHSAGLSAQWVVHDKTHTEAVLRREPIQDSSSANVIAYVPNGELVISSAQTGEFFFVMRADGVTKGYIKHQHLEFVPSSLMAAAEPPLVASSGDEPTKYVLFIRHGQSMQNVLDPGGNNCHNDSMRDPVLSELGQQQASDWAQLAGKWGVGVVLVSPLVRAIETACRIFSQIKVPLLLTPCCREHPFTNTPTYNRGRAVEDLVSGEISVASSSYPPTYAKAGLGNGTWPRLHDFPGAHNVCPTSLEDLKTNPLWRPKYKFDKEGFIEQAALEELGNQLQVQLNSPAQVVAVVTHADVLVKVFGAKVKNCEVVCQPVVCVGGHPWQAQPTQMPWVTNAADESTCKLLSKSATLFPAS